MVKSMKKVFKISKGINKSKSSVEKTGKAKEKVIHVGKKKQKDNIIPSGNAGKKGKTMKKEIEVLSLQL